MFKCEKCEKSADKPIFVVVERKEVEHLAVPAGPRGGRGTQIVREMRVCVECLPSTPAAAKPDFTLLELPTKTPYDSDQEEEEETA